MLLVLDFGFGEGGLVVNAPVDGAEAFVDEVLLEEVVEGFDDGGFVAEGHREIGVVPAAEDADALELGALEVDVLLCVLAAGAADRDGVHLELFAAELLIDFDLDGEAVAVPAGDVGGVEAGHGFGLDDEVFDAFVQGVAEVNGSVGVGRAVVEDVFRGSGAGGADLVVQVLLLPRGEALGLVVRQVGLHREGRLGQVERGFQRLWSGFLVFGLSLWCVRHLFLIFLIGEVQFVPNSYCRRGQGVSNRGRRHSRGSLRPRYKRWRVKLCRMFVKPGGNWLH